MDQATGTTILITGIIAAIIPLINLLYNMYERAKAAEWRHQSDLHAQKMELLSIEAATTARDAAHKADNLKDVVLQSGAARTASIAILGETISSKIAEQSAKIDANTAVNEAALAVTVTAPAALPTAASPVPVAVVNFPENNDK